jgi:hypothetical protein
MEGDLFSKPPEYTIDTSSLIEIFDDVSLASRKTTPGLWEKILDLMREGVIISHIEVLLEIKKEASAGEGLYDWAHDNKDIFRDYAYETEGRVIRSMSTKYRAFVNGKIKSVHADPWIIAQAKCKKIKIISEETRNSARDIKNYRLPDVCTDPIFGIECVNLLELVKERNWKFH